MLSPLAWYLTLAGVALLGGVFVRVARGAPVAAPQSAESTSRIRRLGAVTLGVAAVPITLASLSYAPLRTEAAVPAGVTSVDVVGRQWSWELSQTEVPVGELVVFRVTSADVNHGFAIYDPDMRLIAQTQAMPGYTNGLQVVFDAPGTYRVLCLEYCGLVHHAMAASIEAVTAAGESSR